MVSYPSYQETSFDISKIAIQKIHKELLKTSLSIIDSPERYKFSDTLIFNTPYHLTKKGINLRTNLLLQGIQRTLKITN